MTRIDKIIERLLSNPSDFTYDETVRILIFFGYEKLKSGKKGGSRRKFINKDNHIIIFHEPHPGKIMKKYQLKQISDKLKENKQI